MAQFHFLVTQPGRAKPFLARWLKQQPDRPRQVEIDLIDTFARITVPHAHQQVMVSLWQTDVKDTFRQNGLEPLNVSSDFVAAYAQKVLPLKKP